MNKLKKLLSGALSAAILAVSVPVSTLAPTVNAAGDANYAEALEISLYFYDANACGKNIDGGPLTWRGDCHTYDEKASLSNTEGLSASAKSVVDAANGGTGFADVSGGYHDAGDHVKFNITMGFNGSSLGWAYHSYPEAFKDTGTEGHLFYIMKNNAEYLMKTTYLDSSGKVAAICHTVGDGNVDHGIWTSPEIQTYERKTYWLTSDHNNNRICYSMAAALGAAAATLKNSDPSFASECVKYASALYDFSKQYSGNATEGISFYGTDPSNVPGDKAWAELWLHLADSSFPMPTAKPTSNGCYDGSNYDGWIYSWGKVWGGYACLMAELTGDSSYINEVKFNADKFSNNNEKKYYIINDWGNSRYNCAWQAYALTYGNTANNQAYLDAAKWQMDFILGNNPSGYSYLVGYGGKYPTRIHHRAANPDKGNSKYTLYGALVGGASDSSGSITDDVDSFAQTEMALDYNACFTVACAGLYCAFGGDTSSAKPVLNAASEINSDFDFGGSTDIPAEDCVVHVKVIDADTGELLPGVGVLMETMGAPVTWNTSDENPKDIVVGKSDEVGREASYQAIFTEIPDDYTDMRNSIYSVRFTDTNEAELVMELNKKPEEIIDYTAAVKVVDEESGELIDGVELYVDTPNGRITWNSSDENPKKLMIGNSKNIDPETDTFEVVVTKAPEGMAVSPGSRFIIEFSERNSCPMYVVLSATQKTVYGDADVSGEVDINDVVVILIHAANINASKLSAQGRNNADVYQRGDGLNALDATSVQKYLSSVIADLPESYL